MIKDFKMFIINIKSVTSPTETLDCLYRNKQAYATLASSLLCLSAGLTNGISGVLLPKLEADEEFHWETSYSPWLASLAPLTSILGCLCVGNLLDRYGRKFVHVVLAFPFLVGWLAMAFAHNFYVLLAGRFITGFSFGAVRPTAIIYIGEISDPKYRGLFLLLPSLALNLGILLSHVIGTVVYWRTALLTCIAPNLVLFALLFCLKESPYWLILNDRVQEGIECFRWFRGTGELAENELRVLLEKQKGKESTLAFKELVTIVCSRCFVKTIIMLFFIFLTIQLCGVNAFPFYAHDMLDELFDNEVDTFLLMMIVDVIRVMVGFLICIFGKTLHRKATFVCCAYVTSLFLCALVVYLIFEADLATISIPLAILVFYTGVASSLASLGWTFVAELFPTNVRGLGSGLSGAICFSLLSLCIKITPDLLACGEPVMYGTFATVTLACAIVLNFILPETNGKYLQDIEERYNNKNNTTTNECTYE